MAMAGQTAVSTAVTGGSAFLASQVVTLLAPLLVHAGVTLSEAQENALVAVVTLLMGYVAHGRFLYGGVGGAAAVVPPAQGGNP